MRLMTLAPELPGAVELAAHATKRGVRVSLGHSDATAAETRAAIAVGATVGILAGVGGAIYPAIRATGIDPTEALHYE